MVSQNRDVFINCPFDDGYLPLFHAMIFVVLRSGFRPRSALESDDGSENRFQKICKIIQECGYGIHDISRTDPDPGTGLPRFNMPLELGVFLGAKQLGNASQRDKRCIIFDIDRYRYQKYISDISGQDIHAHNGSVPDLIKDLASWLRHYSRDTKIPGGVRMADEFEKFRGEIPRICRERDLDPGELSFVDFAYLTVQYTLQLRPDSA
jgi:hypothetical protein